MPALLVFSASPFVFHATEPLKVPHHHCLPLPSMRLFEVSQCLPCPSQRGHGRVAWGTSLLQHREGTTSEVLLSPANMRSFQERFWCFAGGDDWRPESAQEDGVYLLPPAGATDPDLQAGLLTAQCVLAVKNNKWIRKETASYLSLPRGLAWSGIVLVHQAGARTLCMLPEEA